MTDGPFAETKDLIAGWMVIDVDSHERAIELAGELSAAPGAGGKPIHEWLEVRPFMTEPPTVTRLTVDDVELRELVPQVLSVLVRRGADFATAEDAVQEALIRALAAWEDETPADPTGWLDHRRVASLPRHDAVGDGAPRPGGPLRRPSRRPARSRAPTTRCASTSCAPTPT